jgi:hypothetical protein
MASTEPLFGPRLKVARANTHIRDLESLLDSFLCDNPHRVVLKEDPDYGAIVRTEYDRPLPNETATIIGDAVHNLRSALDHLACDMVRQSGEKPDRNHGFPIYGDKAGFDGGITSKLRGADAKFLDFVKAQRPYRDNGGNTWLHDLAALDNDDKHIVLTPTISTLKIAEMRVLNPDGDVFMEITDLTLGSHGGVRSAMGIEVPGTKFEINGEPTVSVCFDKIEALEGAAVVDTLRDFSRGVTGIIKEAAKLF